MRATKPLGATCSVCGRERYPQDEEYPCQWCGGEGRFVAPNDPFYPVLLGVIERAKLLYPDDWSTDPVDQMPSLGVFFDPITDGLPSEVQASERERQVIQKNDHLLWEDSHWTVNAIREESIILTRHLYVGPGST